MIGCIKAISEERVGNKSAKLFLDLHTVLAPSGEERTLDTSAQVERAALTLCLRRSYEMRTAGCTVGAPLKRRSLNPQDRP